MQLPLASRASVLCGGSSMRTTLPWNFEAVVQINPNLPFMNS